MDKPLARLVKDLRVGHRDMVLVRLARLLDDRLAKQRVQIGRLDILGQAPRRRPDGEWSQVWAVARFVGADKMEHSRLFWIEG